MKKPVITGSAIKQYGLSLLKVLLPYKVHILILALALAYFSLAPIVYGNYFIKYGKPVKLDVDRLATTENIKYTFDNNETITIDGRQFHQFEGWAFLLNESNQQKFNKYLVLNSVSKTYFIPYETFDRPGVQGAFADLGLDVLSSGFRVLVASDLLQSGIYNVGLLFHDPVENKTYYSVSNRYYIRKPNQVDVQLGALPDVNAAGKLAYGVEDTLLDGVAVEIQQVLPKPTKQIKNFVDGIYQESINGRAFARVVGWSFKLDANAQAEFDRYVVLKSAKEIFYFPANAMERTDVQRAFSYLSLDLRYSGFDTYILMGTLPPGSYDVGIVYLDKGQRTLYYAKTSSLLIWRSDQIKLQRR